MKNKLFIIALLLISLFVLLFFCKKKSSNAGTEGENTTQGFNETFFDIPVTAPSTDNVPTDIAVIPSGMSEKHSLDGEVLITNTVNCPVLQPCDGVDTEKINQTLREFCEGYIRISNSDKALAEEDRDYAERFGGDFEPYEKSADYSVFLKGNVLSIKFESSERSGGANEAWQTISFCFDVLSGERLSLSTYLGVTEDEAALFAVGKFKQLINSEPNNFFSDAAENLPNIISEYGFYLSETGLVLFVNSSLIAPSALGIQSILIEY